ncbi:MAG: hypothetical protein ABIR68_12395 [Ilumatobacteraceae bacterium]
MTDAGVRSATLVESHADVSNATATRTNGSRRTPARVTTEPVDNERGWDREPPHAVGIAVGDVGVDAAPEQVAAVITDQVQQAVDIDGDRSTPLRLGAGTPSRRPVRRPVESSLRAGDQRHRRCRGLDDGVVWMVTNAMSDANTAELFPPGAVGLVRPTTLDNRMSASGRITPR